MNEGALPRNGPRCCKLAVQWALNTAVRRRFGTSPYYVMLGREPRTDFSALVDEEDNEDMDISSIHATDDLSLATFFLMKPFPPRQPRCGQ